MKNYSPAYAAHLQQSNTTLAICWRIVKKNGELILGTDHDRDIKIEDTNIGLGDSGSLAFSLNGVYKASSGITGSNIKSGADMSVDNMEVQGAIAQHGAIIDLSVADIEAGLLDGAEVTTFRVNWQDPSDFQEVLRHGVLGEITRDSDGVYRTEIRGLKQLLSQVITRTFSERCQVVRFGDSECKYEIANDTITGTVTSVTSARRFTATLDFVRAVSGGFFNGGELTFTSGVNDGYMREVKRDDNGDVHGDLSFWERFPNDPEVGDTFTLSPGCPRTLSACIGFGNVVNFRGWGVFIVGLDSLMRGPT